MSLIGHMGLRSRLESSTAAELPAKSMLFRAGTLRCHAQKLRARSIRRMLKRPSMKIEIARLMVLMAGLCAVCYAGPVVRHTAPAVPGVAMGNIRLGPDGAETLRKLPKPYASDVGMSQTRQVWKFAKPGGRFDTLFIHTTGNGIIGAQPPDGVTIDLIRATAKRFQTSQGISVGSTLEQIQRAFPDAASVDDVPTVYDAVKEGIAFEFEHQPSAQSPCTAIMVHPPGQSRIATQENVAAVMEESRKN
jgi:hypothetical protein